jgi:hypothetical protein
MVIGIFIMANKKSKKTKNRKSESAIKGRIVEMIVASLHEDSGLIIEQNVRLPSLLNPKRKREIDVLLSGTISGYPIRIAIECKNYKSIIDAPKIDAFVGKLQQIGIPSQHGVFVSAQGFTSGAIDRAKEAGITPLVLTGLTSNRLAAELFSAVQSVVYLLPEITTIQVKSNLKEIPGIGFLWFLYDKERKMRGSVQDLVWKMWIEGTIKPVMGETEIDVPVPEDWQNLIDGELKPVLSVKIKLKVKGLVARNQGQATQHALIDSASNKLNKFRIDIKFDTNQTTLPIQPVFSEEDLQTYLNKQSEPIKLSIGRVILPRIYFNYLYWPLSERAFKGFSMLVQKCYKEGRIPDPEEMKEIEGNDLRTIWEPPWEENPILIEIRK